MGDVNSDVASERHEQACVGRTFCWVPLLHRRLRHKQLVLSHPTLPKPILLHVLHSRHASPSTWQCLVCDSNFGEGLLRLPHAQPGLQSWKVPASVISSIELSTSVTGFAELGIKTELHRRLGLDTFLSVDILWGSPGKSCSLDS